jgi:hypothetical protein
MDTQSPFGLDSLSQLGRRSAVAMRPTLLRVLTDLYAHRLRHTPEEERHYTELALRLLEAVDVPTRIAVAARLIRHTSPPLRVLQFLAGDVPEVASLLRSHPQLGAHTPVDERPPRPAATPAAADGVGEEARPLPEVPQAIDGTKARELNERFFAANATERRLILLNLNVVAPIPIWLVAVSRDPSIGKRLEAAALAREREDFAQHLATALQIPREQARRIVRDDLGEPVAVAGKALGMPRDVLYRILMFINPAVGHSVERVHALAALYDEMSAAAAAGMVAIWQALQASERAAKYHPVTWDDARPRVRPATVPQRAPAASRTGERRSGS